MSPRPTDRLYFGCWGTSAGHYLHDDHGKSHWFDRTTGKWPIINSTKIDGEFTPKDDRRHGAAKLWHSGGWTVLAFHDYSRDSRGGSNAAFILRGQHTADEVLADARATRAFAMQLELIEGKGPIHVVESHTPEVAR